MTESQEGVIKFELDYATGPGPRASDIASLNGWREILFMLRLIGQDPRRYGGLGYGNLSQREVPGPGERAALFVITGTQTGGLATLRPEHYTRLRPGAEPGGRARPGQAILGVPYARGIVWAR